MENPNMESEYTTLHVRTKTSKKVKELNRLVSIEKGVTVKGYDSVDFAIDKTIMELKSKHTVKK